MPLFGYCGVMNIPKRIIPKCIEVASMMNFPFENRNEADGLYTIIGNRIACLNGK
jgi:hypothetical protein